MHSSGLERFSNPVLSDTPTNNFFELDDFKSLIKDKRLLFEPGTQYQHSNTGLHMPGVVIESVTGQNYFNYIQENIYKIARMKHSGWFDMEQPGANLATGYIKTPYPDWHEIPHIQVSGPAAGAISTVADLHRFAMALVNNKFLSKKATEEVLLPRISLFPDRYGYGFTIQATDNDTIVGNSGGLPGASATLDIYQNKGYVAVVLTNYYGRRNY